VRDLGQEIARPSESCGRDSFNLPARMLPQMIGLSPGYIGTVVVGHIWFESGDCECLGYIGFP
jgi:hypothetical protein